MNKNRQNSNTTLMKKLMEVDIMSKNTSKIQQIQRILLIPAIQQTQEIHTMRLILQTAKTRHLRIRNQAQMSLTAISQNMGRIRGLT